MERARLLRLLGAALLLAGGAIHLELNLDDYGNDDILMAFALNAAASAVVAAYLVLRDDRIGPLAGLALTLGSLGALLLSRRGDGILDFREVGWNPSPEVALTVGVEVAATFVLVAILWQERRSRSRG
jgi:drug/metabolite transporter (DMT)-like permease